MEKEKLLKLLQSTKREHEAWLTILENYIEKLRSMETPTSRFLTDLLSFLIYPLFLTPSRKRLLELIYKYEISKGYAEVSELEKMYGTSTRPNLTALVKMNLVEKLGDGKYKVTNYGHLIVALNDILTSNKK